MNAMTPAERFAVALTPDPTVARIARQRSTLRLQVIFALVFVAVLLLVWLGPQMLPEDARRVVQGALPSWSLPVLVVIWAVPTLARIILTTVFLKRAKQDLTSLGQGVALYIDGTGVEFVYPEQVRACWAEITALKISGRSWGQDRDCGWRYRVRRWQASRSAFWTPCLGPSTRWLGPVPWGESEWMPRTWTGCSERCSVEAPPVESCAIGWGCS